MYFLNRLKFRCLVSAVFCGLILVLYALHFQDTDSDNIDSDIPVLIWWTPLNPLSGKITCGTTSCFLSANRNLLNALPVDQDAAILFYGSDFNTSALPLQWAHKPWAIFHEESPKNLAVFNHPDVQTLFDYTATFSRQSDMPLTLQYLRNVAELTSDRYYVPVQEKNGHKLQHDMAPVLYLQTDCDTPINRDQYVKRLMQHVRVDSYGPCLNNRALPDELRFVDNVIDFYGEALMRFTARYKFMISIENAECADYVTEKLWRPLIVGTIPIYRGAPDVRDWLPNGNSSAILIDEFGDDVEALADFINRIDGDDDLYLSYMTHKVQHRVLNEHLVHTLSKGDYGIYGSAESAAPVPQFECFVCEQMRADRRENTEARSSRKNVYECSDPQDESWRYYWNQQKLSALDVSRRVESAKIKSEFKK